MLDYLFLIPTSPDLAEASLRKDLQKLCFQQVAQLESSFVVWLLGDAEITHPHFKTIVCEGTTKEEKLKEAGDQLAKLPQLAKYLVRLDDDDLINPMVFDELANRDFDIAYDRKHFFYDLATDLASRQKRDWIPNTAIMNFEKAMTKVDDPRPLSADTERSRSVENYLFACDHSRAWRIFFSGRNIVHPKESVYVRILNPESITATASGKFSENNYFRYLQGFGAWRAALPEALLPVKTDLMKIRQKHFGDPLNFKPKRGLFSRLK
ncbi:hypothetical protein O3Q51_10785 [Cryomorphaceae bacterium 1068]|nr:hypothetical protein [Cryomorphaceae bacterium 1068]